jgi:hypothetical protein
MHLLDRMLITRKENITGVFLFHSWYSVKNNYAWLLRCCFPRCSPDLSYGTHLVDALSRKDFAVKDFVHQKPCYYFLEITFILC